mgnify:CR=1 FL=1
MAWDDDKKAQAVEMYGEQDPTPETSMEIVKEIADELNESPNGVRMILTKAGVYVKKAPATGNGGGTSSGGTRVSKQAAQDAQEGEQGPRQAGRRAERLDALATELRSNGANVLPVPLDVTNTDALFTAVGQVQNELGPIQILVNNAGKPDAQLALNMDPAFVDEMVATNLTSLFHLACFYIVCKTACSEQQRNVSLSSITNNDDSLGKITVPIAIAKIPKGSCINLSET